MQPQAIGGGVEKEATPTSDPEVNVPEQARRRERNTFRFVHQNRRSIGLSYRGLTVALVFSVLTGLMQAAILLVLVRLVTAQTAGTVAVSGSIGPLKSDALSRPHLLWIGLALTFGLLGAEILLSRVLASMVATAQSTAQKRILDRYSAASFDAQIYLPRGDSQAVMLGLCLQAAAMVGTLGQGTASLANFATLVLAAIALSPVAAGTVLVGLALVMGLMRPLSLLLRRFAGAKVGAYRQLSNSLLERLHLSRELRSFGVESSADKELYDRIEDLGTAEFRVRMVSRMSSVVYRISTFLLVFGMLALIESTGARNLAALTGSLLMMLRSLSYGQAVQANYQSLLESMPSMEQLVGEQRRLEGAAEPGIDSEPEIGHIASMSWRSVDFAYEAGATVLHNVDLDIERGDFVALIGPSGAGKSTIMNLLLRLREPTGGTITANGIPTVEIDLAWWRSRVAHVPQEPLLQTGTIAEAIRFHRRHISDDDIRLAARRAHIADEIESWPAAYDTQVGQLGDQLSGGQRQRVSIARALAGNPDLLLLDEPTSALDPKSEQLIAETLDEIRENMIIVAIAHRLRTVERANRVLLVKDGRLVPNPSGDIGAIQSFLGVSVPT